MTDPTESVVAVGTASSSLSDHDDDDDDDSTVIWLPDIESTDDLTAHLDDAVEVLVGSLMGGHLSSSTDEDDDESSSLANPILHTHDDPEAVAAAYATQAADYRNQPDRTKEAVQAYQAATACYRAIQQQSQQQSQLLPKLVAMCQEAACWRNMGGIHRQEQEFHLAAVAWREAEALYQQALRLYQQQQPQPQQLVPPPPQPDDDDDNNNNNPITTFCLDALWMETCQTRAALHYRYQQDAANAMDCHEQVVRRLMELDQQQQQQQQAAPPLPMVVQGDGYRFVPLSSPQHTRLLIVSLESLGTLYHKTFSTTAAATSTTTLMDDENDQPFDQGLVVFHDALNLVRERYEQQAATRRTNETNDDDDGCLLLLLDSMSNILRILSDIYFQRGQVDRAVDALHDVMDIQLSRSSCGGPPPSQEAVLAMDKMGQANELLQQYDKAVACYEKALLARSNYLGQDHIDVAKSLINVARVMELQGNTEGSMDLYRAAQAIYAKQVTAESFSVQEDDAHAILKLIPAILEQGRYSEAVAYLNKCLEAAEQTTSSNDDDDDQRQPLPLLDKSQIYYDLGRAYVGLEDYVPATICLVEAAKENGSVTQEQVVAMLQHVEFLQQQRGVVVPPTTTTARSTHHHHHHRDDDDDDHHSSLSFRSGTSSRSSLLSPDDSSSVSSRPYGEVMMIRLPVDVAPSSEPHEHDTNLVPAGGRVLHPSPNNNNNNKGANTPVTWEGLSVCESKSMRNKKGGGGPKGDTFESSDDEEATAYYDSCSEAGNSRIPRSEVSSSSDLSENMLSEFPPITIDPVPSEDDAALEINEKSSSSPLSPAVSRRRGVPFSNQFRRLRRNGFTSLREDNAATSSSSSTRLPPPPPLPAAEEVVTPVLPPEDDFHTMAIFDGPIGFVDVRKSASWESEISQITYRVDDPNNNTTSPNNKQSTSQEWWWGVSPKGFGRWFPSAYVSQAVQAAEGFLSAEAIHAKKKQQVPSPSVFRISDEEESSELEENGSVEGVDHPSHLGIATSKATRAKLIKTAIERREDACSPKHDSLFSSPPRQNNEPDFSSEIARCQERLEEEQAVRGKSHPDYATTLFTLAVLHSRDENVSAAVESATEALKIQKDNGSTEDAIRSLHFLADLQLHQRNFKASLNYYGEALKMESARFGPYSDETAKTLNCIGAARCLQSEFALAMESHQEALTILKESHGEDPRHPLVLDTLCEIGSVYYRERNSFSTIKAKKDGYSTFIESGMLEVIGRAHEERGSYKMAISFFQEKLQFLENRAQNEETLEETATTMNSLGMLCTRAGLFVAALDYYERALSLQLQLGCDDVDVATARVLTAAVHYQLGRWPEALALLEDALSVLQRELGDEQPTVAATLFQLGVVRAALCEHEMAMVALKRALTLQAEILGDDHPATLRTKREIGKMYCIYESELDSAFDVFNDVLEAQKLVHGEKHPNIADTLHCIGEAYARKGDYSNALRVLEESYYMRLDFLGWDHPLQATTLHEIANIHLARGRITKASHICDVVLRIRTEGLVDRHIDVARTLATKGSCMTASGDFSGAAQCFKAALGMVEELVGDAHPLVADIRIEIGVLCLRKCQFDEARKEIQEGLDIYNSKLDKDHPSIWKAQQQLEQVEHHEMLCV